jgi:hypothetical protein
MNDAKTPDPRAGTEEEYEPEEVAGADGRAADGEVAEYHERPTGLLVPMDVMAEIHLRRFVGAFPDVTLQSLEAHVDIYFDWVNEVPHLQRKMAEWAAAATGQRSA